MIAQRMRKDVEASFDTRTSVKSPLSLVVAAGDEPRLDLGDAAVVECGQL